MNKNEQCPCKDCLLLPTCRHKDIMEIYSCNLIYNYLDITSSPGSKKHYKNFPVFFNILKPTKFDYEMWDEDHEKHGKSYIVYKKESTL